MTIEWIIIVLLAVNLLAVWMFRGRLKEIQETLSDKTGESQVQLASNIAELKNSLQQSHSDQEKARQEEQRLNEVVDVALRFGAMPGKEVMHIIRNEFTRAELQGRLANVPLVDLNQKFFNRPKYFATNEFQNKINEIITGNQTKLEILCDEEEFNQFDFELLDKLNTSG